MEAPPFVNSDPIVDGLVDLDLPVGCSPRARLARLTRLNRLDRLRRISRAVWPAVAVLGLTIMVAVITTHTRPAASEDAVPLPPAISVPPGPHPELWYNGWIHDGRWLVGVDVWPGVYRTTVPPGPVDCAWTRYRRGAGGLYVVAVGGAAPGRQESLVVGEDDSVVQSIHCGWWHAEHPSP